MALGFFRKQQKLVVVIMVLLMVAFLIPSTLRMVGGGGSSGNPVLGSTRYGEIHHLDRKQARLDLQLLMRNLQVQAMEKERQLPPAFRLSGYAFRTLLREGNRPELCYALLQQEAQSAGVEVTGAEIDLFLSARGLVDQYYQNFIGEIRADYGLSEEDTRDTIGRWLRVYKHFVSSLPPTAPSLQQVLHEYEASNEQVKVRLYSVDANTYLHKVGEPSAQEINAHWQRYRGARGGTYPTRESFGFGYRQPKRYIMDYLFLDAESLARVVEVSRDAIRQQYRKNPERYTEVIGSPGDPNAKTRQLSLAEAWDQVEADVRPKLARQKLDPLAVRVGELLEEYRSLGEEEKETPAFDWVRERLTASADNLLKRPVTVDIRNEPIARAIEILEKAADLKAICYPFGDHGQLTLDPETTVTLKVEDVTLEEALKRITQQIPDWPRMHWAACTEIRQVLFPDSGVDLFPVRAKRVELTGRELVRHDVLGSAATAPVGGRSLIETLVEMEQMRQRREEKEMVLKRGPEMFVFDRGGGMGPPRVIGKVFWELENIRPSQAPATRTREITREVRRNIRLRKAYELALADANGIDTDEELNEFVRKHQLDPNTTTLFSRSQVRGRAGQMFWAQFPLELPSVPLRLAFLETAFGLIPEPEQADKRPVTVMEIPATKTVAVVKLVDFRYPSEELFDLAQYRRYQAEQMAQGQKFGIAQAWFNFENMVVPRVQWQVKKDDE